MRHESYHRCLAALNREVAWLTDEDNEVSRKRRNRRLRLARQARRKLINNHSRKTTKDQA